MPSPNSIFLMSKVPPSLHSSCDVWREVSRVDYSQVCVNLLKPCRSRIRCLLFNSNHYYKRQDLSWGSGYLPLNGTCQRCTRLRVMVVVLEQNNIVANSVLTWRHHLRHETVNNSLFCGRCMYVWRRGGAGLLVSPLFVKCNDSLQSAVYAWH